MTASFVMGHLTLMHGRIELPTASKIVSSVFAEYIGRRGKIAIPE